MQAGNYIRKETVVSAIIGAAISAAFFFGLFGFEGPVPVEGPGNYAFDFLPQSFFVGLMACLVPTLLLRKAVLAGKIDTRSAPPEVRSAFGWAFASALFALALGVVVAAVLWLLPVDEFAFGPALVAKIVYGAVLGSFVTRRNLVKRLSRNSLAHSS